MPQALVPEAAIATLRISDPAGIRPAAEALRDMVHALCGLRTAVCHNIAVSEPMRTGEGEVLASEVFGFQDSGPQWWRTPQLALSSPLASACRITASPFWCNAHGFHTRGRNPLLEVTDRSDFRHRALAAAAIVVPIHLPFGQIGAASFLSADPEVEDLSREFEAFSETLALYARVFVQDYASATDSFGGAAAWRSSLTKREVECLRWAAGGKTDEEIGLILGVRPITVRFHIRAAARKLDAVNRDQTLFKAAQLGFLGMMR